MWQMSVDISGSLWRDGKVGRWIGRVIDRPVKAQGFPHIAVGYFSSLSTNVRTCGVVRGVESTATQ